jgi:hypothetical protein
MMISDFAGGVVIRTGDIVGVALVSPVVLFIVHVVIVSHERIVSIVVVLLSAVVIS